MRSCLPFDDDTSDYEMLLEGQCTPAAEPPAPRSPRTRRLLALGILVLLLGTCAGGAAIA